MASSLFIEHNDVNQKFQNCSSTDSDLVVVYNKDDVNLDYKALGNLIDRKTLSSISVVRIISPTPSMLDDECSIDIEQTTGHRESDEDSGEGSTKEKSADDDFRIDNQSDGDDTDCYHDRGLSNEPKYSMKAKSIYSKQCHKGIPKAPSRILNVQKTSAKNGAQVLGISLEAFLPPERATEISREALKLAGLSTFKKIDDPEFQLYVIKNDHCYTPFTSPSQKNHRTPSLIHSDGNLHQNSQMTIDVVKQTMPSTSHHPYCQPNEHKSVLSNIKFKASEHITKEKCPRDRTESKNLEIIASKNEKHLLSPVAHKQITIKSRIDSCKDVRSPEVKLANQEVKKQEPNPWTMIRKPDTTSAIKPVKPISASGKISSDKPLPSVVASKPVKEFKINKISNNHDKKFTLKADMLMKSSHGVSDEMQSLQKTNKGFTPISIDTATRNALPIQISVRTHQSSLELAAERDKQLDLIDSIVQNEMQKCGIIENSGQTNENIPELVKMLENTESSLKPNSALISSATSGSLKTQQSKFAHVTEDADIPEDIIQHVVDLIEDNRQFREAVEKEVFEIHKDADATTKVLSPLPQSSATALEDENFNKSDHIQIESQNESRDMITNKAHESDSLCTIKHHNLQIEKSVVQRPLKITRGNGRIITLPPIEAPTTRAKRKAQTSPDKHNVRRGSTYSTDAINLYPSNVFDESSNKAENSSDPKGGLNISNRKISSQNSSITDAESEDVNEEEKDDDDPNKLWCICRQPHNNRFMICCDICQDWFHGTCVNVTKAIGLDMEQKGIDWKCPKCIKKQEEKNQLKITDMIQFKKITNVGDMQPKKRLHSEGESKVEVSINNDPLKGDNVGTNDFKVLTTDKKKAEATDSQSKRKTIEVKSSDMTQRYFNAKPSNHESFLHECIVCKRVARDNTLYCSDDCIRKHIHTNINSYYLKSQDVVNVEHKKTLSQPDDKKRKSKELFEDVLSMADRKQKAERVYVHEPKSGRILHGSKAPTTINIRKWLQENPTYEIINPLTIQHFIIEDSKKVETKPATTHINDKKWQHGSTHSLKIHTNTNYSNGECSIESRSDQNHRTKDQSKANFKNESKIKDRTGKHAADAMKKGTRSSPTTNPEPIRENVRRTLKEQLLQRINEQAVPTLTEVEVVDFVNQTEAEMFRYFNRNPGSKYKAKYRSLIFNIKDRKNKTLFSKICEKVLRPKDLVKLSAEELASQELAQWREKEAKHQLEMITKSELDMLEFAKNLVVKTHKGDEEINNEEQGSIKTTPIIEDFDFYKHSSNMNKMEEMIKSELNSNNDWDSPPKKHILHADTIKKNDHNGKDHEQFKKHGKSSERSKSKSKVKLHRASSSSKRVIYNREQSHKEHHSKKGREEHHSSSQKHKSEKKLCAEKLDKREITFKNNDTNSLEFSLVDKILSSTKTIEEAANITLDKPSVENLGTTVSTTNAKPPEHCHHLKAKVNDSHEQEYQDQKRKFDFPKPSPIIWSGSISMIDVASLEINISPIICSDLDMAKALDKDLDIVGRIQHNTVWDYLYKIKKSPNKEILIIKVSPCGEADQCAYTELYNYLYDRRRLGVVGTPKGSHIKDFYLFPLGSTKGIPEALRSIHGIDKVSRMDGSNILIGILIHIRSTSSPMQIPKVFEDIPSNLKRKRQNTDEIDIDAIIKAPIAAKLQKLQLPVEKENGIDDPYSPGGSTDDDVPLIPLKSQNANVKHPDDALKREMEEINKKIAKQEMEIAGLLNADTSKRFGAHQSSSTDVLSKISIPSNLSQILASINVHQDNTASKSIDVSSQQAQQSTSSTINHLETTNLPPKESGYSSRLAQLSEAELLMMVPDDVMIQPILHTAEPPPPGV